MIETARLRLRPHRADDLDAGFALWSNPATVQHISGTPSTRDESWARLLRYAGHWALLGFGYWAVEERASGRFVGDVGLGDFKRALEPSLDGMPEAGWVLDPTAHGRGYATEAARAALAWADANLAAGTSACIIAPENGPSLRVAEKCGFREWARTTYKGHPTIVLRREASR